MFRPVMFRFCDHKVIQVNRCVTKECNLIRLDNYTHIDKDVLLVEACAHGSFFSRESPSKRSS